MIIRDLKKFIPSIEAHYPHYGNILDMQHFVSDKKGYFAISTNAGKFRHLRIIRDNMLMEKEYDFNLGDIKNIMEFLWGSRSTGIYVLPRKNNVVCGMPTEHVFSYNGIRADFESTFYKTSKFDTVIKSVTEYNIKTNDVIGKFKVMKIPNKNGFIYCNYTTAKESIFNFYSLQRTKDEDMNMPMTPMVVPIHSGTKDNYNVKILPWNPDNIPDLMKLYDYSNGVTKMQSIQNIILNRISTPAK